MKYKHLKTGNIYNLMAVANTTASDYRFPLTAVYVNQDGEVFARPMIEFSAKFAPIEEVYVVGDKVFLNDGTTYPYEITQVNGDHLRLAVKGGIRFCRTWRVLRHATTDEWETMQKQ